MSNFVKKNNFTVTVDTCSMCEYHDHTGSFQARPKHVCHHPDVSGRGKVCTKYWYEYPIICNVTLKRVDIPDWCPRLKSEGKNDREI